MSSVSLNKRFRDYGLVTGVLPVGERNMITDVPGVLVGHVTYQDDPGIRTGVTLIDPGVPDLFRRKLPAACYVGNGFGKLVGSTQLTELGTLETPIALTNTLAVGPVMRGVVDLVIATTPDLTPLETINAVVGETNDGFLNTIQRDTIRPADVQRAYAARTADVAVGCVGAGTGTRLFAWKGGVGTASREVVVGKHRYVVGVLLQTNFGGDLTILGVPVGRLLAQTEIPSTPDGSCMIVIATNAPLSARQLTRIAKRSMLGLARTGSVMAHGSGDYALAFTTDRRALEGQTSAGTLPDTELTPFFTAVVEATEESVYDALFAATSMTGRDGTSLTAFPISQALPLLQGISRD